MPTIYDVLTNAQTGDMFLFRGRRWWSWIIRLLTQSPYSHVGIAWRLRVNGGTRLVCFESVWGAGVRVYPMDKYIAECRAERTRIDWYRLSRPDIDRDVILEQCMSLWTSRYASLWQFWWNFGLGRLVRRCFHLPTAKTGRQCSWLSAEVYQAAGYVCEPGDISDPALTDPGEMSRYTCFEREGIIQ